MGRRSATSDWMEMEQKRGISITSAALQFSYRDHVVNLLDTPGHRDFSEDTYRTLVAADAAVMVHDSAKGVEAQTLKRFEVARSRRCSGRVQRGVIATHATTGKPFATKYAASVFGQERDTIDEAFAGDVIGLVNATDLRVGDTLYAAEPVRFASVRGSANAAITARRTAALAG